jgi:hypothetical protein
MGPPGSGKTTFLEITAGAELAGRKKSEHPATSISAFKLTVPPFPGSIVLVNTPAFNNTGKRDLAILRIISNWVNQTYKRGFLISGLIYFHRISDLEMKGTPLRNWRAFEKICGDHFNKVVLSTTMWDDVDIEQGQKRTQELLNFCKVRARGWFMQPFLRDHKSAADVLTAIVEHTTRQPLQLQKEISDVRLSPKQTTAARALFFQLAVLARLTHQEIEQNLVAMNKRGVDPKEVVKLEGKYRDLTTLLGQLALRMNDLKETSWEHFESHILQFPVLGAFTRLFHRAGSTDSDDTVLRNGVYPPMIMN